MRSLVAYFAIKIRGMKFVTLGEAVHQRTITGPAPEYEYNRHSGRHRRRRVIVQGDTRT